MYILIIGQNNILKHYWNEFNFGDESPADRDESILGPRVEPIYASAVDDSWELSASDSECATNWRKAKNNLVLRYRSKYIYNICHHSMR